MSLATFADNLLPVDKQQNRAARLFVYLCLAATAAVFTGATMTLAYGYTQLAIAIYVGSVTIALAIVVLRFSDNYYVAAHYLTGNIFLQSIFFSADPAVGCIALIGMSAGAALLGREGGLFWISIFVMELTNS